jgi:hypothetical protein
MLQMFSSRSFKSRSGVADVAMDPPVATTYYSCMRSGGGASGPRTRSGGTAPCGHMKTQAWGTGVLVLARSAGVREKWSVGTGVRSNVRTLALPI